MDAELATSELKTFADKEIEERRINPNLPPEVDPPSHRLVSEVHEYVKMLLSDFSLPLTSTRSAERLKRLKHAPQITAAPVAPAFKSFLDSLWGGGAQMDSYQEHTERVKMIQNKAMVSYMVRFATLSSELKLYFVARIQISPEARIDIHFCTIGCTASKFT